MEHWNYSRHRPWFLRTETSLDARTKFKTFLRLLGCRSEEADWQWVLPQPMPSPENCTLEQSSWRPRNSAGAGCSRARISRRCPRTLPFGVPSFRETLQGSFSAVSTPPILRVDSFFKKAFCEIYEICIWGDLVPPDLHQNFRSGCNIFLYRSILRMLTRFLQSFVCVLSTSILISKT